MHKKILGIFVATLMIVTLFASMIVADENKNAISFVDTGSVSEVQSDQNMISRSIWDREIGIHDVFDNIECVVVQGRTAIEISTKIA